MRLFCPALGGCAREGGGGEEEEGGGGGGGGGGEEGLYIKRNFSLYRVIFFLLYLYSSRTYTFNQYA
jgi:hypothetical protein